jgi:hypothetical protein
LEKDHHLVAPHDIRGSGLHRFTPPSPFLRAASPLEVREEVRFMTTLRQIGIGLVFLVGCAVGGASSRFVVPPVSAEQAASLTKWEYICYWKNSLEEVVDRANQLGAEGWEMTAAGGATGPVTFCFKRAKR